MIDGYVKLTGDGLGEANALWLGTEYSPTYFTAIPMYNGGKNNDPNTDQIGMARLGYDCTDNILCIAAYLDETYFNGASGCSVVEADADSWVRFTDNNGYPKLKQTSDPLKTSFEYIKYPDANGKTIGKCSLMPHMQEHELSFCLSPQCLQNC